MKTNKVGFQLLLSAIVLTLTLTLLPAGCTPAKKPIPPPGPRPRVLPEPLYQTKNPAITVEETNGLNDKLTGAISRAKGVKRSTVIVIGTSAYAGMDLSRGLDKAQLEALRSEAASIIKTVEPRIRTVWTATNPNTVRRIDRVRAAIRAGKPASSYASDLRDIINASDLVR
ncbi:MAG: YhcN/YlaJ family sporulation lipoprotein [Eubacteriales bacterium]